MSDLPLRGLRVLITRSEEQAESFAASLKELGATVNEVALLAVRPASDYRELDEALHNLGNYDWVIFASQNAVQYTVGRLQHLGYPAESLGRLQLASIGAATTAVIQKLGLTVSFQPSKFVAESFVEEFPKHTSMNGLRLLWPRNQSGRLLIAEQLRACGAHVQTAAAYETGLANKVDVLDRARELVEALRHSDIVTLASAQTARNFSTLIDLALAAENSSSAKCASADLVDTNIAKMQEDEEILAQRKKELLASVKIATIGPITASAARECLGRVDVVASEHTLRGLTEALLASLNFEQNPT